MKTFVSTLLTASLALAIGACGGSDGPIGNGEEAATVGLPNAPVFGEFANGVFLFKDAQGNALSRPTSGSNPMIIDNNKYGPALNSNPLLTAGWHSNTPWDCAKAEEFATGSASNGPAPLCHVQISLTGVDKQLPNGGTSYGVGVLIIGLDANGQGLTSWIGSSGVRPAPVNAGAPWPIANGPPKEVNVTLDGDAMLKAMLEATTDFRTIETDREQCLMNSFAARWVDIQAHFYCILPRVPDRTCYSLNLVAAATQFPTDPAARNKMILAGYDTCFNSATASTTGRLIHSKYEQAFKYVMFTAPGKSDFDIDSENKTINDYYAKIGKTRPRRQIDTFPAWLPDQPRYEVMRKLQADAQAKGQTGGQ